MVARNHDPEANANDSLGAEHGGNFDQPASTVDEKVAPESKREEPKHEEPPKPEPSGPGLRTTNTPTRRGR